MTRARIFTDGRDWPKEIKPTLVGYAIGKWLDSDRDGRYDTLEVETRGMRGPRAFDATGMPLHADNKTVVKERIYLDKSNPNVMLNDITTFDSSLTRPWRSPRSMDAIRARSSPGPRRTARRAMVTSRSKGKDTSSAGTAN